MPPSSPKDPLAASPSVALLEQVEARDPKKPQHTKNAKKIKEISREEAASILGGHPRTIRNLIKRRDLKATKVAGRWFIEEESVRAFAESSRNGKDHSGNSPDSAPSAPSKVPKSTLPSGAKPHKGPKILACYRLCCHAFHTLDWDLPVPLTYKDRLTQHQCSVLEQLSAGFYSYGQDKRIRYGGARTSLGAILGLLYPFEKDPKVERLVDFIEDECMSALVFLIRKIEHRKDKPA